MRPIYFGDVEGKGIRVFDITDEKNPVDITEEVGYLVLKFKGGEHVSTTLIDPGGPPPEVAMKANMFKGKGG